MKIRVAVCQVDMEWEHTARNLERLEPVVAAADADIAVLPEMFATGFKLRPARVAEPVDGLVATTMRRWAAQYGKASWAASSSPKTGSSATGCFS
jgi:Predicted amidohydrolase